MGDNVGVPSAGNVIGHASPEITNDVNIGERAFIRFRPSTAKDHTDLLAELGPSFDAAIAGDREAAISILLASGILPGTCPGWEVNAAWHIILQKLAAKCFVGWSEDFFSDEAIVAIIGDGAQERTLSAALNDLLAFEAIALKVAEAIEAPFKVLRTSRSHSDKTAKVN